MKHSETVCTYMYVYLCTQKARHNKTSTLWLVLIRKGKGENVGGGEEDFHMPLKSDVKSTHASKRNMFSNFLWWHLLLVEYYTIHVFD